MGILLLPRKDRTGKVALLLGWSLEFGNPCLGPGFAEALPKSEQVLLRGQVATVKNEAPSTLLPLGYTTVEAREMLECQAGRPEKSLHIQAIHLFQNGVKTLGS